jgi:hypothetical protein
MYRAISSLLLFLFVCSPAIAQEWQIPDQLEVSLAANTFPVVKISGTPPATLRVMAANDAGLPTSGGKISPDMIAVFPSEAGVYHVFVWDSAAQKSLSTKHCVLTVVDGPVQAAGTSPVTYIPELEAALTSALNENTDKAKAARDSWTMEALYTIVAEYLLRDSERQTPLITKVSEALNILKEQETVMLQGTSLTKVRDGYPKFVTEVANVQFTNLLGSGPEAGDDLTPEKRQTLVKYFRALAKGARDYRNSSK